MGAVQLFGTQPPTRHHPVEDLPETVVVARRDEVGHLVDDDVLKARQGLLRQFGVEPDAADPDVATAPSCLHSPDTPVGDLDADPGLPLGNDFGDTLAEASPVPPVKQGLAGVAPGGGTDSHLDPGVAPEANAGRASRFDDIQPVAPTLEVVALTGDELAARLAILSPKPGALSPNPGQPGDHRQPHRVVVEAQGRGNAHPSLGRVDTQVQVLDVLADDFNGDTADLEANSHDRPGGQVGVGCGHAHVSTHGAP